MVHIWVASESISGIYQNHIRVFLLDALHECGQFGELFNSPVYVIGGYDHDLFFFGILATGEEYDP